MLFTSDTVPDPLETPATAPESGTAVALAIIGLLWGVAFASLFVAGFVLARIFNL